MRVSTANAYDNTIELLAKRQAELTAQQERLSTGKRVLKPSDDPVAATLAETAANRLSRVQADLRALESSRTSLQQAESGLAESGELLQRVRELLVTAGNGSFGDSEREDIARQLEGLREQLIGVANQTDNTGRTLFGGLGGAATPFVDTYGPPASGVLFAGQRGQVAAGNTSLPHALDGDAIWMRIPQGNGSFTISLENANTGNVRTDIGEVSDPSALTGAEYEVSFADVGGQMEFTVYDQTNGVTVMSGMPYAEGQTVNFEGISFQMRGNPADGDRIAVRPATDTTDIFSVVQDVVDALRYQGSNQGAHQLQEVSRAMTEVDAGLDRVLLARGRVGEWLNRADSLDSLLNGRANDYELEKSRLEDLDMIKGISDFQTSQVALEAALKSYAQVQRLSLFQYVG
ncbi:MAG: flagellar hook-associated protein FlgL [Burkholderiaceae bacterium]